MRKSLTIAALLLAFSGNLNAAEFGDVTAKFVLDGSPPAPKKLDTSKEPMCTADGNMLFDESLRVNKENNGIQDVLVYLFLKPGEKAPEMHPDQKAAIAKPVEIDNIGCRFVPRTVLVITNQTLIVKNSDKFGHNTNVAVLDNQAQNPNLPAGAKIEMKFTKPEKRPVPIACNIHPWMGATLLVKDHPFMAASDENGKLTIKNVPVGERTFQLWHGKFIATAKQDGKAVKWDKGMVKLNVKPGTNDLGEIKVELKHFQN